MAYKDALCTNFIIKGKTRRRFGSEAPSKFVPAEKGRDNILVMSDGVLEQEEVDYLVEAEQYKEDERIKKGEKRPTQEKIQQLMGVAHSTPEGQRAKAIEEFKKHKQREI